MDAIFDLLGVDSDIGASMESIAIQNDPVFTGKLERIVSDIYTTISSNANLTPSGYLAEPSMKKHMHDLETLISTRFGIPVHIIGTDGLAYTIPISGKFDNIIDICRSRVYDYFNRYLKKYCGEGDAGILCRNAMVDLASVKNENELFNSESQLMATLKKAMDIMTEAFSNSKIAVDFKKAYIYGVKDVFDKHKFRNIQAYNFNAFLAAGLSVRETVSIILHETGHSFMDIAYANMFVKTSFTVLQSITNDFSNFTNDKKVTILYKKVTGKDAVPDVARRGLIEKLVNDARPVPDNMSAFYNSEITADQFPARFGYGKEVVMSLNTFGISDERLTYPLLRMTIGLLLIGLGVALIFTGIGASIGVLSIMYGVQLVMVPPIQNLTDPHELTYARIRRMKLELIRQLRTSKQLPVLEKTLEDIIEIDNWLESNGIDKATFQLFITYITGKGKRIGFNELYDRIEQLSENDLHAMAAKLKQIKL